MSRTVGGLGSVRLAPALAKRRTTPDHIADALRRAILTGSFQDSEVLSQVALAEHFGVSRVPVREALRQLQAEGLITVEAHHRVRITGHTVERVVEMFEIRTLIEAHLLRKAVPKLDAATLERAGRVLRDMEGTRDHRAWLDRNREFHRMLYEPAGAPVALQLVEQLAARNERYLHLWTTGRGIERVAEANDEHRAILAALKRKDGRRAIALLEEHIEHTRARVERLFREREADQAAGTTAGKV